MSFQGRLFTDGANSNQIANQKQSITDTQSGAVRDLPGGHLDPLVEHLSKHRTCACQSIDSLFADSRERIRELRTDGHLIDSRLSNGIPAYVYRGFRPLVRISHSQQVRYYTTDHWKRTAAERKSIDGFACVQCGTRKQLETHHWHYDLFNEDILFDLMTLCRGCHERVHERIRQSQVRFPKSVSPSVARVLGWRG